MLKAEYKQMRVDWAKYHLTWKDQGHRVIFYVEKKFFLMALTVFLSIGYDIRKEEIFSKIQQGGGSLMVWGGFGYSTKLTLAFFRSHTDYQEMLKTCLLPFAEKEFVA